jgi:hypothetical protein
MKYIHHTSNRVSDEYEFDHAFTLLYKIYKYPFIICIHLKQTTNEREVVGDITKYGKEGITLYFK